MNALFSGWASKPEQFVRNLFEQADIQIGGTREQDIHVTDPGFYARVLRQGTLGLGEAYMDGWWTANKLEVFVEKALRAGLERLVRWNTGTILAVMMAMLSNRQNRTRSKQVATQHYDLSGILPSKLLDPYNQYTCAYFDETDELNVAQEKKLHLICRKLQLKQTDRVLDIGCGWGGFAKFAAEHYGCHVTGLSISEEQIRFAKNFCEGLPVDIVHRDYRDLEGTYDKVLICGMIEHVGYKNYRQIFQIVHDHLAENGLYLLHTIGNNYSRKTSDPFIEKYIFPNGMLPSVTQIDSAREGLFTLQDLQNLGAHYGRTLQAWHKNMQKNWHELSQQYDERFRRMFEYYLLCCAGSFNAGHIQHWQMVFSQADQVMDYRGPR